MIIPKKVSIIGAGFVGSTIAYTLMLRDLVNEIVLVDINLDKAEGEAMDMNDIRALDMQDELVRGGKYEDIVDSQVVVVTAGTNQKPGETRLDMVARNAIIIKEVANNIRQFAPEAIVLVVSNPVDIMTQVVWETTGFPVERVFGSGTTLDSARFRQHLSHYFNIGPKNIHGYILGEHGDSEFPAWSLVNIAGMGIDEAALKFGIKLDNDDKQIIADNTKKEAYEIINRKGATYYGIATSVATILNAILNNQKNILPLSVLLRGEYGIEQTYLSVPVVLGSKGVEKILAPDLPADELEKIKKSAEVLREIKGTLQG